MQFAKSVQPHEHVQMQPSRSPDGSKFTILFDNLAAEVGRKVGSSTLATQEFSATVPVEGVESDVAVSLDIRGYAAVDPKARALLLIKAGSEVRTLQWEGGNVSEFTENIISHLTTGSDYQVTLFLLVERDGPHLEATAILTVDSLDLSLGD